MLVAIYAACIGILELSVREYNDFISSPWVHEFVAGTNPTTTLIVRGPAEALTQTPGALPVVVCWIGEQFAGSGPAAADVVLTDDDVGELGDAVARNPLAATTLAVLLRAAGQGSVADGLARESAAYSLLQAGPEFAAWHAHLESNASPTDEALPPVVTERDDDTLTITLNRPHHHNAITTRLRDELCAALAVAIADDSITTVVLRGNGPSFCSGGDLHEFGQRPDPATAHITRLAQSPARLLHTLSERVVAHVHGATLGGGIELAAFAHRVVARPDTTFGLPEVGLGLIPGAGGTVSITRRIGRHRTAALALTNRRIDASTAFAWGLVDSVDE